MKRVKLGESAYIDLTDEQYKNCDNTNVVDKKTGELLYISKTVNLEKNMILIVPLTEFKDIDD